MVHSIIHLLLSGVSVLVVAALLPGMKVKSYTSAVLFAFVIAFLNTIVWHIFGPVSTLLTIITLGVGGFVINGMMFLFAGKVVPGIEISGCFTAAIASFGVMFVNWLMQLVFGNLGT